MSEQLKGGGNFKASRLVILPQHESPDVGSPTNSHFGRF